jgi:hypothetical protein
VPVAGAEVTLERMLAPGTTWHALDTVTTDANGVAAFSTPVRGNGAYRAEYAGDVALAAATAAPVPLDAMRDFNAEVAQTRTGVFLHGNVNPGWGRHRVSWQRRTCDSCDWRTLSTARTSRTGAWRFQGAWSREGRTWWFRAKLAGTAEFVTSTSSMLVTSRQ